MYLNTLLSMALLASAALAASSKSAAPDLARLERQLASAKYQATLAARLVKRTKTYAQSASTEHKRSVFVERERRWAAETARLERLLKRQTTLVSASQASVSRTSAAVTSTSSKVVRPTTTTTTSKLVRVTTTSRSTSTATTRFTTTTTTRSTTATTRTTTSTTTRSTNSASKSATASATRSTAAPVATLSSGASKKKGVGYNDAALTKNLAISWAYNWGQLPEGTLSPGVEYIPMLWSDNAGDWFVNAQKAIDNGSKYLLAFNEPDLVGQADMTVAAVVAGWKKYMSPFKGKAKLVSPAVTNGGAPLGRDYLAAFFDACPTCLEETDAIALHWYDAAWNTGYFTNYLQEAHTRFGKPIWLTEFAGSGTVAEQQAFFATVLPWMEKQPWIERYAGFGDFVGTYVNSDASLTALGEAYSSK
ncbi:glycoside hydrolase family 128 protein [Rhodotorula graminis WP1]|uniref:Glycoside hydrolase family 128 protein n=1 Tax=Rhodotorula graminis (strain WP1) TaxID=578459 RepID=A0A0P9EMK8_RHOGW|nr:glycoside hydrolase family 128 protein [Rhodotorula graminis WP1]KPV73022.1 glycoside hydrolase family 128 protein [Rhodotorula graminis WP1]